MANAVINSVTPVGGIPLAAEGWQFTLDVTAPAAAAQTSFAIAHGDVTPNTKIQSIIPINAEARDLMSTMYVVPTEGVLRFSFTSQDLAGTERFHVTFLAAV